MRGPEYVITTWPDGRWRVELADAASITILKEDTFEPGTRWTKICYQDNLRSGADNEARYYVKSRLKATERAADRARGAVETHLDAYTGEVIKKHWWQW